MYAGLGGLGQVLHRYGTTIHSFRLKRWFKHLQLHSIKHFCFPLKTKPTWLSSSIFFWKGRPYLLCRQYKNEQWLKFQAMELLLPSSASEKNLEFSLENQGNSKHQCLVVAKTQGGLWIDCPKSRKRPRAGSILYLFQSHVRAGEMAQWL